MGCSYVSLVAKGNISPCRFFKVGSADHGALQCVANEIAFGISSERVVDVPYVGGSAGVAGRDGTVLQYYGLGEQCELEVGEAVAANDLLKPNADGRGVVCSAGEVASARVIRGQATAGQRALVFIERAVASSNTISVNKLGVLRRRVTTAEVNAGLNLLAAVPGFAYRVHDVSLIAIGGNAATATSVDIRGTQSASVVNLLAAAVAGLTQNTLLRAGAANAAILAAGASFVQNDANTPITIAKTGSNLATATHIDVLLTYEVVAA